MDDKTLRYDYGKSPKAEEENNNHTKIDEADYATSPLDEVGQHVVLGSFCAGFQRASDTEAYTK